MLYRYVYTHSLYKIIWVLSKLLWDGKILNQVYLSQLIVWKMYRFRRFFFHIIRYSRAGRSEWSFLLFTKRSIGKLHAPMGILNHYYLLLLTSLYLYILLLSAMSCERCILHMARKPILQNSKICTWKTDKLSTELL